MPDFDTGTGRIMAIYAIALGIGYILSGVIEVFGGAGMVPGDIFGGLALFVIAATYITGVPGLLNGEHGGLSFLMGGLLLSAVFGVLYILAIGADGLEYIIGAAETLSISIRPEIWLFLVSLPLAYQVWKLTREVTW